MYRHPIVADSIAVALNSYDGSVYAFGRGPSKTSVSAPQTVIAENTPVMITGSVTDQTPASKDTPAIADESMGKWMEYIHMQKVIPGDAKGVNVTLSVIDPNGNAAPIGTATTDLAGNFALMYTPPVAGTYQITATFMGSESYGSSFATTYLGVTTAAAVPTTAPTPTPTIAPTESPTPTPVPTTAAPEPKGPGDQTFIYVAVAAVAIIAVVIAAAVILRKRK